MTTFANASEDKLIGFADLILIDKGIRGANTKESHRYNDKNQWTTYPPSYDLNIIPQNTRFAYTKVCRFAPQKPHQFGFMDSVDELRHFFSRYTTKDNPVYVNEHECNLNIYERDKPAEYIGRIFLYQQPDGGKYRTIDFLENNEYTKQIAKKTGKSKVFYQNRDDFEIYNENEDKREILFISKKLGDELYKNREKNVKIDDLIDNIIPYNNGKISLKMQLLRHSPHPVTPEMRKLYEEMKRKEKLEKND